MNNLHFLLFIQSASFYFRVCMCLPWKFFFLISLHTHYHFSFLFEVHTSTWCILVIQYTWRTHNGRYHGTSRSLNQRIETHAFQFKREIRKELNFAQRSWLKILSSSFFFHSFKFQFVVIEISKSMGHSQCNTWNSSFYFFNRVHLVCFVNWKKKSKNWPPAVWESIDIDIPNLKSFFLGL